jgi:hypothetical protein
MPGARRKGISTAFATRPDEARSETGGEAEAASAYVVERHDLAGTAARFVFLNGDAATFNAGFAGGALRVSAERAREYLGWYGRFGDGSRLFRAYLTYPGEVDALEIVRGPFHDVMVVLERKLTAQALASLPTENPDARFRAASKVLLSIPGQKQADESGNKYFSIYTLKRDGRDLDLIEVLVYPRGKIIERFLGTVALLLRAPDVEDETKVLWIGAQQSQIAYSIAARRHFRARKFAEARGDKLGWAPSGATEDLAEVSAEAAEALEQRLGANDWERIWPSEDRALRKEARAFASEVDSRCPDFRLCLEEEDGREKNLLKRVFRFPGKAGGRAGTSPAQREPRFAIRRWRLSFWPGYALYEVGETHGITPKCTQFLWCEGAGAGLSLVPIDGSSNPIRALNKSLHGNGLQGQHVLDYIRFFCNGLQGSGGIFQIIERVDDLSFRGSSGQLKIKLADLIHPVRRWRSLETGDPAESGYHVSATVVYARALFEAHFHIGRDWETRMVDANPLEPDLNVRPNLWTARTHFLVGSPVNGGGARE